MDILKSNFVDNYDHIASAINDADFISFDGEFSGIGEGGGGWKPFDNPNMIYSKCKKNVDKYMLMQLGLCTFKFCRQTNSFDYKAFNVYLFPRIPQNLRYLRNLVLDSLDKTLQTDSISFLSDRGFDFNKWINEGVNYLRDAERVKMEHNLNSKFAKVVKVMEEAGSRQEKREILSEGPVIPDSIKSKINMIWKDVRTFMEKSQDGETIEFENLNAFERKFIIKLCDFHYRNQIFRETDQVDGVDCGIMVVRKCRDFEQKIEFMKQRHDVKLGFVSDAEGFTKIIKLLSESGKPIVGHNVKMDVMQLMETFLCALPDSFGEFQKLLHNYFPRIYDTKILAEIPEVISVLTSSALTELVHRIAGDKRFQSNIHCSDKRFGYDSADNPGMHDAGYDAYSTGAIFIGILSFLADLKNPNRGSREMPWNIAEPYENFISCGGRHQVLQGLHVTHANKFEVEHIFRVRFPADWKKPNVEGIFKHCGNVRIYWADDNSAFVTLLNQKNAIKAVRELCNYNVNRLYSVEPLAHYLEREEKACC